jgi:hypothetical protein
MRKLTKREQKYLEAWRGLEKFGEWLRTNPKTKDEYQQLIERAAGRVVWAPGPSSPSPEQNKKTTKNNKKNTKKIS